MGTKRSYLDRKIDLILKFSTEKVEDAEVATFIFQDLYSAHWAALDRRHFSESDYIERSQRLLRGLCILKKHLVGKNLEDALKLEDHLITMCGTRI